MRPRLGHQRCRARFEFLSYSYQEAGSNVSAETGNRQRTSADIALLLIKAGADVNAKNDEGTSAIKNTPRDDVKRVLLDHGAIDQDR